RIGTEQRIGEGLAKPHLELPLLGSRQGGKIDAQRLAQLDQQRGGHGALVVLDQVEIAGGDAKPAGQHLLGKRALVAQAPDDPADLGPTHLYILYNSTRRAVNPATTLRGSLPDSGWAFASAMSILN